ncbi:MAG: PBP1A family penicillin-binding protein [Gammaproteobacteria bacterium]|nr:PBP1A family penicillin-binding protein [Gammaproteobacteria bacterium]MBT8150844.1 PBP1A family penicillin-binding protein [Gammaproteobacteria bacterium]NND38588.1 PBP1A family penicillin-binding protein [Pseudomonadales bacterium]NNM11764.1 PBP1A family penicillin-binding protein [Pseudomonadales bacterium]
MRLYQTAIKTLLIAATIAIASGLMVASAVYLYLNPQLPPVQALREANLQMPLRVYANKGELIGVFGEKFRTPLRMDEVPEQFVNAILAAEDDRFLKHRGVDIAGLLRAAFELLKSGEIQTGGSTITMQVARNFFLSSEQTFLRKFNEILLALKIERLLSKNEILELYINKIYLGKRAYGVAAASAIYYGKDIDELNIAQLAMIAGLPKAPSSFNPVTNPDRARTRRNWILGRMYKLGFIDEETFTLAREEPVTADYYGPMLELDAGYAAEMARAFAVARFGEEVYAQGMKVITTIDSSLQRSAEKAVVEGLQEYGERHGYRGPERRLGKISAAEAIKELKNIPQLRGTEPLMIQKFEAPEGEGDTLVQKFLAMDATGNSTLLEWRAASNPIARYIDENRRDPAVTDLSGLLAPGDVVRVQLHENNVAHITQIPEASASLIALQPFNGAIQAVVGGYDFESSKFNRATQAYRQPGSNFKPFIYAAAFEKGYTAASVINDAPIVFNDAQLETDWRPENASGKFYGPTTLRRALYLSRNLVSVRLLREMGIDEAIDYLERFKLSAGKFPRDLSLALGSYTVTPLEVASLYASIANGGYRVEPFIVSEIRDREDKLLYRANPALACDRCADQQAETLENDNSQNSQAQNNNTALASEDSNSEVEIEVEPEPLAPRYAERVIDERVAFILDSILQEVVQRGTGARANALGRTDLAGKTGTTNGPTDAWFSGYHPQLVATTWLGFDDNRLLGKREFGGSAALPMWMKFMREALRDMPVAVRNQPEGLVAVKIDRLTGLAPTASTTQTLFEKFREENAPEIGTGEEMLHSNVQVELHEELF